MRVSSLALLVIIPFASAAPILGTRGILTDIDGAVKDVKNALDILRNSNATAVGVLRTVKQSIENLKLTDARIQVIKGLRSLQTSLDNISSRANSTGNTGVQVLVSSAQQGVSTAHDAINRIGDALVSGNTPSKDDQKAVAVGIKAARTAVNSMAAAITKPNSALIVDITGAVNNMVTLQRAGENVLAASNITFADLGLPDDFAN